MGTGIEVLELENFLLRKEEQPADLRLDYKNRFAPD